MCSYDAPASYECTHSLRIVSTLAITTHPPRCCERSRKACRRQARLNGREPREAPAGRGPTDARHSRLHARSRSHHGHRSATVTPESLRRRLASCRAPRHCRLATPPFVTRRRRRVTSFAFPSGGAPSTGASLHLDRALPLQRRTTAAPAPCTQTAPTAARASRLFAHVRPCVRRDVQNWASEHADCEFATTAAPARVPPGPGRQHVGPDHRLM